MSVFGEGEAGCRGVLISGASRGLPRCCKEVWSIAIARGKTSRGGTAEANPEKESLCFAVSPQLAWKWQGRLPDTSHGLQEHK